MLISNTKLPKSTIGDEIKNENVTPMGSPALVKPINSGIEEQEQKGVTVPRRAAIIFAHMHRKLTQNLPASLRRKVALYIGYNKNENAEQNSNFQHIIDKKLNTSPDASVYIHPQS